MGPVTPRLLAGFGAVLLVAVLAHGVEPEMATMVVGLAKCADCTRKNMKAEAAFNGTLIYMQPPTIICIFAGKLVFPESCGERLPDEFS